MFAKKIVVALAVCGVFGSVASAHGLWLGKVNGDMTFSYGHSGTDTDEYSPDKIAAAYGFKADGSKVDLPTEQHDKYVTADLDGVAIAVGEMDNGYWAKGGDGKWYNKRGDQVEGADSSGHYFKYTVAYLNPRGKVQPAGLELEIVPEVNPATLEEGGELKVQVLYQGKPLEGAEVDSNYFDSETQKVMTDKDGYAVVPVETAGFNIIAVGHNIEGDDPFDKLGYHTTLTFEAKHDHHH